MNNDPANNPLILAVETSGRTGSVAIAKGPDLVSEIKFSAPMKHSAELFLAIEQLLEKASKNPPDIEHIYISVGPGSFTGLRIATTLAKTLNLAQNSKIVAVDTLDVIAENITPQIRKQENIDRLAVILDAKRSRFFIAAYEMQDNQWQKTTDDCLMHAEEFLDKFANPTKRTGLIGEGLVYYKDKFTAQGIIILNEQYWAPHASAVHKIGSELARQNKFADPLKLTPKYIQTPDAKPKKL